MDTSFAGFYLTFSFFVSLASTAANPGFLGLDSLLHGTQYETRADPETVKILHFTRKDPKLEYEYKDVTQDFKDVLNFSLPLVIVVHGFMGSAHSQSSQLLIQAYVNKGGSNVLGLEWKELAKGPWYGSAADEAHSAAKLLAEWMNKIVSSNLTSWDNIHVVGFSLGAQVAGLTSKYLPTGARVGRITGLDPARPMFDDKMPEDRLDAEDSDFTTVLHTCGGFLAFTDPVGHVDFYPNGGENPQPPCKERFLDEILYTSKDPSTPPLLSPTDHHGPTKVFAGLVCSHYIALALWVESLQPNNTKVAKHCSSWKNYLYNNCNKSASGDFEVVMGENTPRSVRGTFYIETEEEVSFAPQLKEMIEKGVREYSKLFTTGTLDSDQGHGEVQEVIPTVMSDVAISSKPKQTPEGKDNFETDNMIAQSSRNFNFNFYTLILLISFIYYLD